MGNLKLNIRKTLLKRKINGAAKEGYYGRVITAGTRDFDKLAELSCVNTTVHKAEMKVAAELFLDGCAAALKEGYIVDLGPLGKLYPAVSGPWKEDADELQLSEMSGKVNYRPSADIQAVIAGAEKSWTTKVATDENSETETPANPGGNTDPNNNGELG